MVEIKPFKGLRYNKEKISDFSSVITPPYDVISKKEKQEFSNLSEHNVVNLLLEEHEQAAKNLKDWQEKGILKKDDQDSIYIYSQTFAVNGKEFTRTGFISLLKLEELGAGVLPHEKTLDKPFQDRLDLLEKAKANFGCIFMLYDDRQKIIGQLTKEKISSKEPDMDFKDSFNIKHKLWRLSDEDFITKLKKEMQQYQCVIADGHHRYKSTLKFRDLHPALESAKYIMCCFINSFNEGLFVLPIDRFVFNLKDPNTEEILTKLKEFFDIEEAEDAEKLIKKIDETQTMIDKTVNLKNHVFGMYSYSNKKSYFLKLKDNKVLDSYYPDKSDIYKKLDINILHKLIFQNIFGITKEDQAKGTNIKYTKSPKRALEKLKDDKYQFAFFIKPPLMREIFLTARENETMPQKATYFYPKVYSGLVINKLE